MPDLFAALILAAGLLFPQVPAQVPAQPAASATPREDPAVTALALKIYGQMRQGKVDESLMTDDMNKHLTPDVLAQTKPMFDQLGEPLKLTLESTNKNAQGTQWVYLAVFAAAQLHVKIFITPEGKVGGYAVSL
jgi:hypothetical protein